MSTTKLQARTRLRSMLREPTANKWSDTRLDEHLQDADWEVYKQIARIRNAGYGELAETITLPANATSFSLTPGSNPTALTKNLKGIVFIEHQNSAGFWTTCNEMQEADEAAYRSNNVLVVPADVPPLYRLRRPNITFLPQAGAARTLRVVYRPLPTAFASDNSTLDVDDDYVLAVITRAAIFALADLGEDETQFSAGYGALMDEIFADLAHMTAEGRSLQVKVEESASLFSF